MFRWFAVFCAALLSSAILTQEAETRAGGDPPLSISRENENWPVREGYFQPLMVQADSDYGSGTVSLCGPQGVVNSISIYVSVGTAYYNLLVPDGTLGDGFWFSVSAGGLAANSDTFTILPQPHITDFAPQAAAPGQEVTVWGAGFDSFNFASLSWNDAVTGDYYYSVDVAARMQNDGSISFAMPQSIFVRRGVNGVPSMTVDEVSLSGLEEANLVLYASSDGASSNLVDIKVALPLLNATLYPNADTSYVFMMGRDSLHFVSAGNNIDSVAVSLAKTKGTKCAVPVVTLSGASAEFNETIWQIPADVAAGLYTMSFSSGNCSTSTREFTIVAPPVIPQIVYVDVPTPASPDGLGIDFSNDGDGTPAIVNLEPQRFFLPQQPKRVRGVTSFRVYDIQDPKLPSYWKKKLGKH